MPPLSLIMCRIGVGQLSCGCPTFKGSTNNKESSELTETIEPNSAQCDHKHHRHRYAPISPKASKAPSDSNTPQSRTEKINNLLRAESINAVLDVFNATVTTDDENKLVTQIQQATKDSKTYPDSKAKIVELCGMKGMNADAVFGLLAKFRHERNLLTTAILKSNTEREKTLLCIKRVDDLMYMLQEAAKRPKDSGSNGIMARLSEIILQVHDLAKNPSAPYEELLDIKEEHMRLLDDHDDMHQKFMEVNACHDKLHASHDKLQSTHTKLTSDYTEAKKKSSLVNGLKNDVGRLEKAIKKKQDENHELKKEVENLSAELTKVNALKHEVAQLKKKVTTLSTSTGTDEVPLVAPENPSPATHQIVPSATPPTKKKKGKKGTTVTSATDTIVTDSTVKGKMSQDVLSNEAELNKLRESHASMMKELDLLRDNLAQIDKLRRTAEASRDKALERLQLEQATSQNWQEISGGHAEDKAKLEGQLENSQSLVSTLQSAINRLEQNLTQMTTDLSGQKSLNEKLKTEQDNKAHAPASLSHDTVRLLHKIKVESSQLARDVNDSMYHQVDLQTLINMIQMRVVSVIEKDLEDILGTRSHAESVSAPEAVLPFAYQGQNQYRSLGNNSYHRFGGSPLSSPHISSSFTPESSNILPHRPMIPPGFGEPSPSLLSAQQLNTMNDVLPTRITATPSSTSSVFNASPILSHNLNLNSNHGPVGSRIPSQTNRTTSTGENITPPPSIGSSYGGGHNVGLGNGAIGVDWSMWSKAPR